MQYGGRKRRKENDPDIINELILDSHRMTYKKIIIFQQDLSACFDQAIQNISNICNQKFLIPHKVCSLNTKIKKEVHFYITLSQGTSQEHYTNTNYSPVHGSLQG